MTTGMTGGEVDYYGVEELLTEEERITRASVRSFVEREALPVIEACHAREEFPRQLIPHTELGLFGASLKGYGCRVSNVAYGVVQEPEAGDSGLRRDGRYRARSRCSPSGAGNRGQKQRWLPSMAAGKAIGAFGHTEPIPPPTGRHGDPRRRDGDG
jgi:glutaryl-CoA dehydrogenase